MNGNYYPNPTFPGTNASLEKEEPYEVQDKTKKVLDMINKNKIIKVYTSFKDDYFEGVIKKSDKNYLLINNLGNGEANIIPWRKVNYISFDES